MIVFCTQSDECCWRYIRNQIFYSNKDESLANRPGVIEQIETVRSVFCLGKMFVCLLFVFLALQPIVVVFSQPGSWL
jgi:hypothetical protein